MTVSNASVRFSHRSEVELCVHANMQTSWPPAADAELPRATFALGCFWGPQLAFERIPGVVTTAVGYTGGRVVNPTYEAVCISPTPGF